MKSIKLQLFFVVLAFLTMIVVSILYVRAIVNQHMAINSEEIMGSANATIQSLLSEAEITLANVAFSIDNLLHEDTSFENIEKFFVSVSRWHDTDKREYFAFNGLYGFINDRYIDGSGWVPPADYNPRMRPWYIGAAVTNDIYYTDPYTDADSGNTVISVSKKLGVTDPASVIAIDFDITAVSEYIENLHIASGGYGMLINNRMEIVSHENHEMTGQSVAVATSPYHSFADVLMNDDPKEITSLRVTDYNGKHSIVFISRLFNGWHIAIITPLSSYYDQLRTMAIVISLLGTVLTAVLCIILLKLNSEKAKADEKNQMKSSFLAKMSHEIRTHQ